MDVNQFALYQLKNILENRQIRFRPYSILQEKGIQIQYKNYEQEYLARMQPGDEPEQIRRRFNEKLPRTFHGHSISVSDVLVLNKDGVVTSYYVEKDGFTVIAGFIRMGSSGALVSVDTSDFHIEGKEGSWHAFDSITIDGRQFFLMEHETYGKEVAWVVLDEEGKIIVDHTYQGFDQTALQQIKDYHNPPQLTAELQKQEIPDGNIQTQSGNAMDKPLLENWQRYMENGEYLRSSEIEEEQNYNMIDGRRNNMSPRGKNGRASVLEKLRRKQAEIAKRYGKPVQQMAMAEDIERRRK
ncbi:YodL domain-containing protein [Lachnospiraceae bacterium KK002]